MFKQGVGHPGRGCRVSVQAGGIRNAMRSGYSWILGSHGCLCSLEWGGVIFCGWLESGGSGGGCLADAICRVRLGRASRLRLAPWIRGELSSAPAKVIKGEKEHQPWPFTHGFE